jgi:hypothetical protein
LNIDKLDLSKSEQGKRGSCGKDSIAVLLTGLEEQTKQRRNDSQVQGRGEGRAFLKDL